jgi:hypothetical protein
MRLLTLLPTLLLLAATLPQPGAPFNDALANAHPLAPRQSRGEFVALTPDEIARIESQRTLGECEEVRWEHGEGADEGG